MCGLLGVASNDMTYKEIEAFKELLYVSSLRGQDSTGVAVFKRNLNADPFTAVLTKSIGTSAFLLDSKSYDKAIMTTNKKILMGHTRAATRGDVRVANAHPFEFDRTVAAHNGTLDCVTWRTLKDWQYFDTDSEGLIYNIDQYGLEDVIPEQEGAWALSIVDKANGTLTFLRNDQRSLCYCFNEDRSALYWASEAIFLRFVLVHRGIKIHEDKVYGFAEDTAYTFDVPVGRKAFDEPERKTIKGKQRQVWFQTLGYKPNYKNAQRVFGGMKGNHNSSPAMRLITKHIPRSEDDNPPISRLPKFHEDFYTPVKPKKGLYLFMGYQGRKWNENTFKNMSAKGCAFCGTVPDWGDNCVWLRVDAFICPSCSGDDAIEEAVIQGDLSMSCAGALNDNLNDQLPTIN